MSLANRILITGGMGFAGTHLVELLLSQGETDLHVTSMSTASPGHENWLLPPSQIHQLDLTNTEAVKELLQKLQPTQIYHLAAISEVGNSFQLADKVIINNAGLQLSLLEGIRECTPKARVVIVGSAQEYDLHVPIPATGIAETHPLGPANPYAVSKVVQDLLALSYFYSYRLDLVRARPFNHIGEGQSTAFAIPSFAKQIVAVETGRATEIVTGNLETVRDFTDVKDVVQAYTVLMAKGQAGEAYNIGSGQGVSMQQVLEILVSLATVPISITTDAEKFRPHDAAQIVADISKIKTLGWQPTIPITQTLERVIKSHRTVKER